MFYSAAWTDSGFLLGCSHEHETIVEADSCIPCGYLSPGWNFVARALIECTVLSRFGQKENNLWVVNFCASPATHLLPGECRHSP